MKYNWCYDIETYPNFWCVTFKRLNKDIWKVFICYGDIIDFIELVKFINEEVEYLISYNGRKYDNVILNYIMMNYDKLIRGWNGYSNKTNTELFNFSQKVIAQMKNLRQADDDVKKCAWAKLFKVIDLYNFVRVGQNGKSLKMVSVILKHNKVQDLPYHYLDKIKNNQVENVLLYNRNDVVITEKLCNHCKKMIQMRSQVGELFDIDVIDASDSDMGFKIVSKLYKEKTGIPFKQFKELRTIRFDIRLGDCISPNIKFKTKLFQDKLEEIKNKIVYPGEEFEYIIEFNNKIFVGGKGGLHTEDESKLFTETLYDSLIDLDVNGYYPQTMINDKIKPEHCDDIFSSLIQYIVDQKNKADKEGNTTMRYSMKIAANSVFGKLNYVNGWLYDEKAFLSVTLNCQMYILMLVELLGEANFQIITSNTDGITCVVPKLNEYEYYEICKRWEEQNKFTLEYVYYSKYARRDINNYIAITNKGKVKKKGDFVTEPDIQKGYDMPIVAIALENFFVRDIPVDETIKNHKDIYDFCKAQKIGPAFNPLLLKVENGEFIKEKLQKTNRYYISTKGYTLIKNQEKSELSKEKNINLVKGEKVMILNDVDESKIIDTYNIDYRYYIRNCNEIIQKILFKDNKIKKKAPRLKGIKVIPVSFNQINLFDNAS